MKYLYASVNPMENVDKKISSEKRDGMMMVAREGLYRIKDC
jgi:hypothetical protein